MKREKFFLTIALIVVFTGGTIFYINGKEVLKEKKVEAKENLADCLTGKNIKFYGSSECLHCDYQKDVFGEAFSKINYIECKKGKGIAEVCLEEGINVVPVWSFPEKIGIKKEFLSCRECIEKSGGIACDGYCYEVFNGRFYVTGTIDLEKLGKISGCVSGEEI